MARSKKFTVAELEGHLEMIDIYWNGYDDETQEELEKYLKALFAALPSELREVTAKEKIAVDYDEAVDLLSSTLGPAYSPEDVVEELNSIWNRSLGQGGKESGDRLIVRAGTFLEIFDLHFNGTVLSDELLAELQPIRTKLSSTRA